MLLSKAKLGRAKLISRFLLKPKLSDLKTMIVNTGGLYPRPQTADSCWHRLQESLNLGEKMYKYGLILGVNIVVYGAKSDLIRSSRV